jgi:nucleoid-associated protein YgaU
MRVFSSRTRGEAGWGNFFLRLDVPGVPDNPQGTLEVFEFSAEDGSEINKVVRRIVFGRSLRNPYTGFAVHEVRSGDTLSKIADHWYGDAGEFRTIFQANRHLLDDPDVIVPGQLLRIPQ